MSCKPPAMTILSEGMTVGDVYGRAMKITDQAEADAYFEEIVRHWLRVRSCDPGEARRIVRENLGYWTGYYDDETAIRVQHLFRCEHPIFGKLEKKEHPSPQEIFAAGKARGERLRDKAIAV